METRPFGTTGLEVSALGYGAGGLGSTSLSETEAEHLLHAVLDLGLTVIDTAPSYGLSEERIGRHLAGRRGQFVLSTKVGYGVPGVPDWTYEAVAQGIDAALRRLQTDWLDIVHLHSCPRATLETTGVIDALEVAREGGKVRAIAYSGENEDLAYAIDTRRFDALQTSLNVFDQRDLDARIPQALDDGLGVIAKRPLANAPWRFETRPDDHYCLPYWERMQAMGVAPGLPWPDVALRFAAFSTRAHTCIAGTTRAEHLRANVAAVEQGPLPGALVETLRAAFRQHDDGWAGQV